MDAFVYRTEPVEILISPAGTIFTYQDQPMLRNAPIMGIDVLTANTVSVSPISGTPILPIANLKSAFFTAYMSLKENANAWGYYINQHPLITWNRMINSSADPYTYQFTRFSGQIFQWQKCSITLSAAVGGSTTYAIYMQVYYNDPVNSNT